VGEDEDCSESKFITRDGLYTNGIPDNGQSGLCGDYSEFPCGQQAAVIAKCAAYEHAIRGPVTPDDVREIGQLLQKPHGRVASFQAFARRHHQMLIGLSGCPPRSSRIVEAIATRAINPTTTALAITDAARHLWCHVISEHWPASACPRNMDSLRVHTVVMHTSTGTRCPGVYAKIRPIRMIPSRNHATKPAIPTR
jgi:hypothetical protein